MNQTFQSEVEFLRAHGLNPIVLGNDEGARLVTLAEYQGRVMTSTMAGDGGAGCGWINRALIASGKRMPHINAYGGEDRFWLGPEGGQFSLYFPPGAPFDFDHWQVPAAEDTDVWKLDSAGATAAAFSTEFSIRNWSGFEKMIRMERLVRLLDCAGIAADLGVAFDKTRVSAVGYVTENRVTNIGPEAWTRENGALSIWMLGMFNPSARTVIVIPYRTDAPGAIVKDDYFGRIPADRLRIDSGSSRILFSATATGAASSVSPTAAPPACSAATTPKTGSSPWSATLPVPPMPNMSTPPGSFRSVPSRATRSTPTTTDRSPTAHGWGRSTNSNRVLLPDFPHRAAPSCTLTPRSTSPASRASWTGLRKNCSTVRLLR